MKVHHIGIESVNLAESIDFFHQLGFQTVSRLAFFEKEIILLQLGECTIELYEGEENTSSPIHLCMEVDDLSPAFSYNITEGPYQLENGWQMVFV